MIVSKEMEFGGRPLTIEVGKVAKQADGAAWVRYGDTVVVATAVSARERAEHTDFFPLTVDYREMKYAGGQIPGGFFKREARPRDKETLIARMTDRPIRPLFPKGYYYETQVLIRVYSHDGENEGDIPGALASSVALMTSDIPFESPIATVIVGRIDGEFVINPTTEQLHDCEIQLMVAGTEDAITMVEGEAKEVSEDLFLEALDFAHDNIKTLIAFQKEVIEEFGQKPTREWEAVLTPEEISQAVREEAEARVDEIVQIQDKAERKSAQSALKDELLEKLTERFPEQEKYIGAAMGELVKEKMRRNVLDKKVRLDGRGTKDIRDITIETGLLPRVHGSSLFTRGQTQSLGSATLGTREDEQKIDDLEGTYWKTFMLHYNFPPFCVGEVRRIGGPGRRELGHGHLAERSIKALLPAWESFPYTIRV
ncbi:polyribonucleotide nucleotidyltransferase, partial [bacterium]|nr:polyribonucleotide nucleotidyltransferase [bacterium]